MKTLHVGTVIFYFIEVNIEIGEGRGVTICGVIGNVYFEIVFLLENVISVNEFCPAVSEFWERTKFFFFCPVMVGNAPVDCFTCRNVCAYAKIRLHDSSRVCLFVCLSVCHLNMFKPFLDTLKPVMLSLQLLVVDYIPIT